MERFERARRQAFDAGPVAEESVRRAHPVAIDDDAAHPHDDVLHHAVRRDLGDLRLRPDPGTQAGSELVAAAIAPAIAG